MRGIQRGVLEILEHRTVEGVRAGLACSGDVPHLTEFGTVPNSLYSHFGNVLRGREQLSLRPVVADADGRNAIHRAFNLKGLGTLDGDGATRIGLNAGENASNA